MDHLKTWPSKKKVEEKKLIFILFEANQNLKQFGTLIENGILSFYSTLVFKMPKPFDSKTSH